MQKYQNKQSGFSLIELAIVVVVVALLTVAILKSKTIIASFKCLGGSSQYSSNISLKDRADKITQVIDGNLADAESEINNLNNSKGSFRNCVDLELDKQPTSNSGGFSGTLIGLKSATVTAGFNNTIQAGSATITGYIENNGGNAWLLVGRGREGWNWNDNGMGTEEEVIQGLGTSAAFAPKYYSAQKINDILTSSGIDLTGVEIRLKRSISIDNSLTPQEVRWRPVSQTSWTWLFDSGYYVNVDIFSSDLNSSYPNCVSSTRDGSCGDGSLGRIFTFPWVIPVGFSFGASTQSIMPCLQSDSSFLFVQGGLSDHCMPYTEVYIRAK